MSHHANDGSASRVLRGLLREHGYNTGPSLASLLAAYYAQGERRGRGEHDETVAELRRVTYVQGNQVKPGTHYCRYCSTILEEQ